MIKKNLFLFIFAASATLSGHPLNKDITNEIPEIQVQKLFEKIPDVAHYKNADWSQVIGISHGVSLFEAKRIAHQNPDITFFFYVKGYNMVLEKEDGSYRRFSHGDAVFFSGQPWWGSAPGLADGYIKN